MNDRNSNANTWAIFCHLSSLSFFLLLMLGIPVPAFANILGPLLVWAIGKDKSEFVDRHGRESINFQISMTIYSLIVLAIAFTLLFFGAMVFLLFLGEAASSDSSAFILAFGLLSGLGLVTAIAVFSIIQVVLVAIAAIKASQGKMYRYPFTLRLVSDRAS